MKKRLLIAASACLLAMQASANETETETVQEGHMAPVHAETGFYTALKAQITSGNTVEHSEGVKLEGHQGKGIGLEFGYKIGHGFSVEADGTFTRNTVTESNCETGECENTDADGEYMTVSLDLAYTYHLTHHLGMFVKTGYEYENESIDALEVSGHDTGLIYAAGAEYAVGEHTAFMAEYEGTTIDGPRGNSIFAGIVYNF